MINKALNIISKIVLTFAIVAVMAGVFSIRSLAAANYNFSRITASDFEGFNSFGELFDSFGNFVPSNPAMLSDIPHPTDTDYIVIISYNASGAYDIVYLSAEDWFSDDVSGPDSYGDVVDYLRQVGDEITVYYLANGPRLNRGGVDFWSGLKTDINLAAEAAKNTGKPQTVDYKGVGALPESVIDLLRANPLVTLNYEYVDAQGNSTFLVLNADILAFAEANVHWFGPKYIQRMIDLYNYSKLCIAARGELAVYTVQEGDTYASIAALFGIDLDVFMKMNALNPANGLRVGQKVIVKYV
ncbi:MAG: LysM peptidoglycan-binding domain-containing protein [Lachnospiraceae bacterium]|nr:LysM peptidoglycan-binding domain-containing protein [Lachnospiraceae bacterium]